MSFPSGFSQPLPNHYLLSRNGRLVGKSPIDTRYPYGVNFLRAMSLARQLSAAGPSFMAPTAASTSKSYGNGFDCLCSSTPRGRTLDVRLLQANPHSPRRCIRPITTPLKEVISVGTQTEYFPPIHTVGGWSQTAESYMPQTGKGRVWTALEWESLKPPEDL